MKEKIKIIKDEIIKVIQPVCKEKFWVDHYGAYDIDPKFLVFWVCVQSDKMKRALDDDPALENQLRKLLVTHDYPDQARQFVHIGFESQETVDRESLGNWYHHFK